MEAWFFSSLDPWREVDSCREDSFVDLACAMNFSFLVVARRSRLPGQTVFT
jgi:hypothetical protein